MPKPLQAPWSLTRTQNFATPIVYHRHSLTSPAWDDLLSPAGRFSPHILLTDSNVARHYLQPVSQAIEATGRSVVSLVVPPGESAKSLYTYSRLCEQILAGGIDRHTTLIALGGGVVNNLGGFIASTLYRGIPLIQAPTTLLSQLDAAIDFRQAINSPYGKNQIGSYYPASAIVADPDVLRTLDQRQIRSGLAEAAKHALTQDPRLLEMLLACPGSPGIPDIGDIMAISKRTIELKLDALKSADKLAADLLLQYGHAWGHALEHISDHKILHGEGIAIGMCLMAEVALELKVCGPNLIERHLALFTHLGLPTAPTADFAALAPALMRDKFYDHHGLNAILLADVGKPARGPAGSGWIVTLDMMENAYRRSQSRNGSVVR